MVVQALHHQGEGEGIANAVGLLQLGSFILKLQRGKKCQIDHIVSSSFVAKSF